MKNTVKNSNPVLKTIAVAAAAVLLAGSPMSSFAKTISEKNNISSTDPQSTVNIQYIGSTEKMFEFKVEFENPSAKKFTLIVKNDNGDVVYSKEYNDVHFAKTIRLLKDGIDNENIYPTFAISIGTKLIQHSFSIENRLTEDVTVTKF